MLERTERAARGTGAASSIGDGVYASLRKNIVNLNLRPGEALKVKAISEKLGVSRTPVRDAFIKLEKEGLVDVFPQKGTSVSRIDLRRVDEERFIRESLEEKAMGLFLAAPQPAALERLERSIGMQRGCGTRGDYRAFIDHDDEFHGIVFLAVGKEMSWRLIQNMSGHYRRVRLMSLWDGGSFSDVLRQHEDILRGLRSEDPSAALESVRAHFKRIAFDERKLMEQFPGYFKEQIGDDFLRKDFLGAL